MKNREKKTDGFKRDGSVVIDGFDFSSVFLATAYLYEVGFTAYEAFQYLELLGKEAPNAK